MRGIVVGTLVVLVLAGCAATPGAQEAVVPSANTPSAEPGPRPTAKPALAELVIGPEGLGPLLIGQAPPSFGSDVDVLVYVDDYCEAAYAEGSAFAPGLWVANYPEALADEANAPFGVAVADTVVQQITVYQPGVLTERGIGVGSTREEVLAAYPEGFSSNYDPAWSSSVYVVDGVNGHLMIELLDFDAEVGANTVFALSSAPIADPLFSTAATDVRLGRCVNG